MLPKCCHEQQKQVKKLVFKHLLELYATIPTLQQRCDSKLFCLEILSSFVLDYLMYPYYPSLPIYCYHFVINLDNSHNISQSVVKFIITDKT